MRISAGNRSLACHDVPLKDTGFQSYYCSEICLFVVSFLTQVLYTIPIIGSLRNIFLGILTVADVSSAGRTGFVNVRRTIFVTFG